MVTSSPLNNQIEIVGIVSWGNGCARKGFPGSYVNVIKYKEFIQTTISRGECAQPNNQLLQQKSASMADNKTTLARQPFTTASNSSVVPTSTVVPQVNIEAIRALGSSNVELNVTSTSITTRATPNMLKQKIEIPSTPMMREYGQLPQN